MVKPIFKRKRNFAFVLSPAFVACVLFVVLMIFASLQWSSLTPMETDLLLIPSTTNDKDSSGIHRDRQQTKRRGVKEWWFIDEDAADNARTIQRWRSQVYAQVCANVQGTVREIEERIHKPLLQLYHPPPPPSSVQQQRQAAAGSREEKRQIPRCPFVLMDFGANVGDSLGKMISAGFDTCPALLQVEENTGNNTLMLPRYSTTTGRVGVPVVSTSNNINNDNDNTLYDAMGWYPSKKNELVHFINAFYREDLNKTENYSLKHFHLRQWRKKNPTLRRKPEDYCYFGIEGNPVFTKRLQELESRIMMSHPRPLQHVHFFTETVVTKNNGPTVIYLDEGNAEKNFWGSSIVATHKDVVTKGTPVHGLSLSYLIQQVVSKQPGQLLIKMDVEGAEWEVLNEAFESGVLCEYAQAGVRIRFLIEIHEGDTIGESPAMEHFRANVQGQLEACGVILWLREDAG